MMRDARRGMQPPDLCGGSIKIRVLIGFGQECRVKKSLHYTNLLHADGRGSMWILSLT